MCYADISRNFVLFSLLSQLCVRQLTPGHIIKILGKLIAVIFIDLKKGFDTVDHDILLSKLDFNGISGNSLK